ncbi:MAG: hypothetical protein PHD97_07270 [Bacteroidales bacterium]|nr:hypothetical protein [Bacteroidales bacterium]
MNCCGKKLESLRKKGELAELKNHPVQVQNPVYYQYTGNSGLMIKGKHTGIEYNFNKKGIIAGIDFRDATHITETNTLNKL